MTSRSSLRKTVGRVIFGFDFFSSIAAILIGFVIGGVLMTLSGANALLAYEQLFLGAVGDLFGVTETLIRTCPLLIIGLGLAIAFKGNVWNIGADGQFFFGAIGAAGVSLYLMDHFGRDLGVVAALLTLAVALASGSGFALIPGYLKARWRVNEIITTIMLNYVALYLTQYLVSGPWRDPQTITFAQTPLLMPMIPKILAGTRLHVGVLFGLALVVVVYIFMQRTTTGFSIKVVGKNLNAALYAGMSVGRVSILAMGISGALAGLAAWIEIYCVQHRLLTGLGIGGMGGYGYTAVAVALLGMNNALGVLFSAIFFGALDVGASAMQLRVGIPMALVSGIQGTMVLVVVARAFLARPSVIRWLKSRRGEAIW